MRRGVRPAGLTNLCGEVGWEAVPDLTASPPHYRGEAVIALASRRRLGDVSGIVRRDWALELLGYAQQNCWPER